MWNLRANGAQILRAADCKPIVENPFRGFRQTQKSLTLRRQAFCMPKIVRQAMDSKEVLWLYTSCLFKVLRHSAVRPGGNRFPEIIPNLPLRSAPFTSKNMISQNGAAQVAACAQRQSIAAAIRAAGIVIGE